MRCFRRNDPSICLTEANDVLHDEKSHPLSEEDFFENGWDNTTLHFSLSGYEIEESYSGSHNDNEWRLVVDRKVL